MFKKCVLVLGLTIMMALAQGESPRTFKNTSFLGLLSKYMPSTHTPRAEWTYRPQEDSHRHAYERISHGSALKAVGISYEHQNVSDPSQEYYWPKPTLHNYTNYYGYSKPSYGYFGQPNAATEFYYKDTPEKLHSRYPYQQIRPLKSSHLAIKTTPNNYKEKLRFDTTGKIKYKKPVLQQPPSSHKNVFSRVIKPYTKQKYPVNHPLYKRFYYQSPYQRYAISPSEMSRYKGINAIGGYYKTSTTSPSQDLSKRYTTERMDDVYPDGSTTWEDYSTYKDTNQNTDGNYYEESYEEVEKTTSVPYESSQEEGTTRGYYGDRIYMSTQVPLINSEKTGVKNKYFIIRRTSHDDDDIETLFE